MGAAGEDQVLPVLGGIGLHDSDTTDGLPETSAELGADLLSLAEGRAQPAEATEENGNEGDDDGQHGDGESPVEMEEDAAGKRGGDHAAAELDHARPDEALHSLVVVHDAGDELAALVALEAGDRQSHEMPMKPAPQLGDGASGGNTQDLREGERGACLDQGCDADGGGEGDEEVTSTLTPHLIDEDLGGGGKDQTRDPAQREQQQAKEEASPIGLDQVCGEPQDGTPAATSSTLTSPSVAGLGRRPSDVTGSASGTVAES